MAISLLVSGLGAWSAAFALGGGAIIME